MAREHANIWLEVWNDPHFQSLTPGAQRLYFLHLSQKTINNAGVLPLQISKWAKGSVHSTTDEVEQAFAELVRERFELVDYDTEEVLVRSYVRRDGLAKHKYLLRNALTMAKRVESPALRGALAVELRRLGNPEADAVANEITPDPVPMPPEPHSDGIPTPSESESNAPVVVVVASSGDGSTNVDLEKRRPRSQAKRSAPTRGTRIPDDFAVSAEMVAWARENTPDVDGRTTTAEFIDYWRGRPGREGEKLDWPATWRNAMRREQKWIDRRRPARASPNGVNPHDAKIANFMARGHPPNLLALEGGAT